MRTSWKSEVFFLTLQLLLKEASSNFLGSSYCMTIRENCNPSSANHEDGLLIYKMQLNVDHALFI